MRILFWNTYQNDKINTILTEIIMENHINIVILAEYNADIYSLITELRSNNIIMEKYITTGCKRIQIIGNITNVKPELQTDHVSMQIINDEIILCCIHLSSQIYSNSEGVREIEISKIIQDIQSLEIKLKTSNTIVVGDFNSNPFDKALIDARLFHSLPYYDIAKRKVRTIAGQEFQMFYNPMWNFLGDFKQPYGTHYYGGNKTDNIFFHLYDQVIIRPDLRERFVDGSLKIVTETKSRFLLKAKGIPDENISDHLPIIFEIKER